MYLIAAYSLQELGDLIQVILMVAAGLGFVIFVHELGHFLVAKLCGVKCEKFYLGFDIAGLKLFKFQWGETEYGLGILPFGGYVKMLGQDDNPSGEAADIERAKTEPLDPRSYKAQTVPERMAIISAGVIMNLIFACVMGAIAYEVGVRSEHCGISGTLPGEAAWQADMQPGDMILQINDRPSDEQLRFRDLQQSVLLSDPKLGVRFKIKRDGIAEPFWVTLRPERSDDRLAPMIGALAPQTTQLRSPSSALKEFAAVGGLKDTPAGKAGFRPGDTIAAVDGEPTPGFAGVIKQLARRPNDLVEITVARREGEPGLASDAPVETTPRKVEVAPRPLKLLGLVMKLGPITAIQNNSVAADAGLKADDQLVAIDDEPVGDPITLPERIRRKAGAALKLSVERKSAGGKIETLTKTVTPRESNWWERSLADNSPLAVTALGIAYRILPEIESVAPDSPAAKAEIDGSDGSVPKHLMPGMKFTHVQFLAPKSEKAEDKPIEGSAAEELGAKLGWPCVHQRLQMEKSGVKLKLTLDGGGTVVLDPVESGEWFNPDRGFLFEDDTFLVQAKSVGEAARMGIEETREQVGNVYGFLRRLGDRRISPLGLGGPITIATEAGRQASGGIAKFLIFLTFLSANLAVINFLPIPILDGGHMVFLALEAIFRRPVNERVQLAFTYVGLLFILGLMLFVVGLDLSRLFSWI